MLLGRFTSDVAGFVDCEGEGLRMRVPRDIRRFLPRGGAAWWKTLTPEAAEGLSRLSFLGFCLKAASAGYKWRRIDAERFYTALRVWDRDKERGK